MKFTKADKKKHQSNLKRRGASARAFSTGTAQPVKIEWLDQNHWLQGTVGNDYDFIARVLPEKSVLGVNGGRTDTFILWNSRDRDSRARPIAEYYDHWRITPEDGRTTEIVQSIISRLEQEREKI